jgi:predicted dehydrogenase
MTKEVLIIGTSQMAYDYIDVFKHLEFQIILVGRSEIKKQEIESKYPEISFFSGGIRKYLETVNTIPDFVINTVDIINLFEVSRILIEFGVKNLLIEKPGALQADHLNLLKKLCTDKTPNVFIGYNRRFYNSVIKLKELIYNDGGIKNAHFEFTEWINTIDPDIYPIETLNKWIYSNSSHVIDLVFSIIGNPISLESKVYGSNEIFWHKNASIFTGMGYTNNDILFTYNSNWCGPGRWSIEFITSNNRYYLKPLEKLYIQKINSIDIVECEILDTDDFKFKPGLLKQVRSFISEQKTNLLSIDEQLNNFKLFDIIGGYRK